MKFFKPSKIIIYSKRWTPGVFIKRHKYKGQIYLRIWFPNRIKYQGMMPMTDVVWSDVTSMRKLPSPFKIWLFGIFGKKPKGKHYIINHSKKSNES